MISKRILTLTVMIIFLIQFINAASHGRKINVEEQPNEDVAKQGESGKRVAKPNIRDYAVLNDSELPTKDDLAAEWATTKTSDSMTVYNTVVKPAVMGAVRWPLRTALSGIKKIGSLF